jgi:hypothetical protein
MILERLRKFSLFDWLVVLGVVFLLGATMLKVFFPGYLKKVLRDDKARSYAEITVVVDPRFEWLRDQITRGDSLFDFLEGIVWSEVLDKEYREEGPFKGRTLVRLKVVVKGGDSGPTAYARYRLRVGERYVFECPEYIFESLVVKSRKIE